MKKRVKREQRKIKLLAIASLVVFILLLATIGLQTYKEYDLEKNSANLSPMECIKNSDCIIARGSCCSCENGGAPQCIAKINLGDYAKKLESCLVDGPCIGVDCGKIECSCVNNKCVGLTI